MRSTWSARLPRRPDSDHTRHRRQQRARLGADQVAAQHEHLAARVGAGDARPCLAHAHQRFQRHLQVLHVGCAAIVEDHEVDGQALDAPVLVRLQQLAHDGQVVHLLDAQQHDGQVAGDALRPQALRAADAAHGSCPEAGRAAASTYRIRGRRVAGTGWPARRRCRNGAAAPAHASRPAWRRACMRVHVAMLVDLFEQRRARLRHAGPVGDAGRAARGHADAVTQREHRVEHRAGGAGQTCCLRAWRAVRAVRGRGR